MRLEGWNHIPTGYGADFDVEAAPRWLRIWFRTPFLDRFAYPLMVKRGFAYLAPHPGVGPEDRDEVSGGWRLRPGGYQSPDSVTDLR
jgi:hypothetical protein